MDLQDLKSLKRLYDSYNKEKEKRKIAEENHKVLSLDLGQALKDLGLPEDTIISDELVLEINKRYVSKDKIKEKIEELEQEYKEYKNGQEWEIQDDIQAQIIVLQELLKGE